MVMLFSWHSFFWFLGGSVSAGLIIWFLLRKKIIDNEKKASEKIRYARIEALLEAKEGQLRSAQELEEERIAIQKKYANLGADIAKREVNLKEELKEFQEQKDALEDRSIELNRLDAELDRKKHSLQNTRLLYRRRLAQVAKLSEMEARERLKEDIAEDCKVEIRQIRQEILGKSLEEIEREANRIMIDTMQRLSSVPSSNMSAALVKLPNEEIKGRLIGKEGRNIRSFELETGTTLLIDETPGTVMVSSFDPVRREIAKLALESLIQDGRIHPASIEESVEKSKARVEKEILMHGERALTKLNLNGVGQEVVMLLGKLYFRLSNNQNTLEHSVEVAYLCSIFASELGLDAHIAKRCGLFHDIGKAIDCESEGSHASVAGELLRRNGEDPRVVNAVEASHQEVASESVYAELLKLADKVSAVRPGARSDSMDGYIQRIKSLEEIVQGYEGIEDVYVIQAGREIRVIVSPDSYEPHEAQLLASKIRQSIENQITFPGKIKVTVIREQRFVDTAQ